MHIHKHICCMNIYKLYSLQIGNVITSLRALRLHAYTLKTKLNIYIA